MNLNFVRSVGKSLKKQVLPLCTVVECLIWKSELLCLVGTTALGRNNMNFKHKLKMVEEQIKSCSNDFKTFKHQYI